MTHFINLIMNTDLNLDSNPLSTGSVRKVLCRPVEDNNIQPTPDSDSESDSDQEPDPEEHVRALEKRNLEILEGIAILFGIWVFMFYTGFFLGI